MSEDKKNSVAPGQYVELGYDLYTVAPDGTETLVHQTDPSDPERIVFGVTQGVIEPLEAALDGLAAGDAFDVKVAADKAFGQPDPEQIVTLPKEIFEVEGKFDAENIVPGKAVPMMTADGYRITGTVVDVDDKNVRMDFNHPLAGKDVRFRGKVTLVRPSTPEDLKPAHGCGCGDNCGCGDDCNCTPEENCGCGGNCK